MERAKAGAERYFFGLEPTTGKLNVRSQGGTNPAMILKATKSVRGSGNIYRGFDVPDADVRQLKAALAAKCSLLQDCRDAGARQTSNVVDTQLRRTG